MGGRVDTLPGPPDEDLGPQRVWLKDIDIPGLAMSRSIGDDVGFEHVSLLEFRVYFAKFPS